MSVKVQSNQNVLILLTIFWHLMYGQW